MLSILKLLESAHISGSNLNICSYYLIPNEHSFNQLNSLHLKAQFLPIHYFIHYVKIMFIINKVTIKLFPNKSPGKINFPKTNRFYKPISEVISWTFIKVSTTS